MAGFVIARQVREHLHRLPAQPLAGQDQPFVEWLGVFGQEPGEKVPPVEVGGLAQPGVAGGAVRDLAVAVRLAGVHQRGELVNVEVVAPWRKLDRLRRDEQHGSRVIGRGGCRLVGHETQRLAEPAQGLA